MSRKAFSLFLLLLPLSVCYLEAESLEELASLAYTHNCAVRAAEERVCAAEAKERALLADFYPHLSFEGGYQHDDLNVRQEDYPYGYLQGRWNLFRGGRDAIALRKVCFEAESARLALCLEQCGLYYQITEIALEIERITSNLTCYERLLQNAKESLEIAQRKFYSGVATELDVILLESFSAQFALKKKQEQIRKETLLITMGALIGCEEENRIIMIDKVAPPQSALYEQSLKALVEEAICCRYDTQMARLQIAIAAQEEREAYRGAWPTLDLVATQGKEPEIGADRGIGTRVYLHASLPLYQGGRVVNRRQEACHQRQAQEGSLRQAERMIAAEIEGYLTGWTLCCSSVEEMQSIMERSEKALAISRHHYEIGVSSMNDLIGAEETLFNHCIELYGLKRDLKQIAYQLERSVRCGKR